jgi:hypothetical protein
MTKARSNAVANAAKGDLTVGNGTNLSGILAVGSNGDTLVADSSTSTGLRYQAPVQQNPVLNSAFQIAQRGTSFAGAGGLGNTLDRWQTFNDTPTTTSRQVTGDTTNLPNIQYCARNARNSGSASLSNLNFGQTFESINSIPYAGKLVTLSFYARRGANFSSASNILTTAVNTGTGTDQNMQTGFTGGAASVSGSATLTTTWQRFSYSGTIPTTCTQLGINFQYAPTGTAGAADYYEVTGVQLEVGSVATPFKTYAGTIQGELAACQRYYFRTSTSTGGGYAAFGNAIATSTTAATGIIVNPVPMRINPSSVDSSTIRLSDATNGSGVTSLTITLNTDIGNPNVSAINLSGATTALTQYRPYFIQQNNSTAGYLGFSAEL